MTAPSRTTLVIHARMLRTLAGIAVGAALAVAGAAMQGMTRNPLADPGILGINAGATTAVVLGVYLVDASDVGRDHGRSPCSARRWGPSPSTPSPRSAARAPPPSSSPWPAPPSPPASAR